MSKVIQIYISQTPKIDFENWHLFLRLRVDYFELLVRTHKFVVTYSFFPIWNRDYVGFGLITLNWKNKCATQY